MVEAYLGSCVVADLMRTPSSFFKVEVGNLDLGVFEDHQALRFDRVKNGPLLCRTRISVKKSETFCDLAQEVEGMPFFNLKIVAETLNRAFGDDY